MVMKHKSVSLAGLAMTMALVAACSSPAVQPEEATRTVASAGAEVGKAIADPTFERHLPMKPSRIASARERDRFESLQGMVAASDLVIVASVQGVEAGRAIGELQFRADTLEIDQILKGEHKEPLLILEEAGWWDGEPWTFNHAAWAQPGDQVLVAVRKKEGESWKDNEVYVLASTQARFFLQPNGTVRDNYLSSAPSAHADRFVQAQAEKSVAQLLADVEAAAG